jgi:hypothetical protein
VSGHLRGALIADATPKKVGSATGALARSTDDGGGTVS